eukprot:191980-Chlamydomonas_euryale.AAC.1
MLLSVGWDSKLLPAVTAVDPWNSALMTSSFGASAGFVDMCKPMLANAVAAPSPSPSSVRRCASRRTVSSNWAWIRNCKLSPACFNDKDIEHARAAKALGRHIPRACCAHASAAPGSLGGSNAVLTGSPGLQPLGSGKVAPTFFCTEVKCLSGHIVACKIKLGMSIDAARAKAAPVNALTALMSSSDSCSVEALKVWAACPHSFTGDMSP